MDGLIGWIVIASVVSSIVGVLFWVAIAVFAAKAAAEVARSGGGGPWPAAGVGGLDPQFLRAMQQLSAIIAQAQAGQRGSNNDGAMQGQFASQMLAAQRQFHALDDLSRQKHETFVSGMLSDASAAGLDVSGWNIK